MDYIDCVCADIQKLRDIASALRSRAESLELMADAMEYRMPGGGDEGPLADEIEDTSGCYPAWPYDDIDDDDLEV